MLEYALSFGVVALAGVCLAAAPVEFHVSSAGNNANAGDANAPFADPVRARDAVRALKQQAGGSLKSPVHIVLHGGTYAPLELLPEDSGTVDCPAIWMSAPGTKPVLSAGQQLGGWKQATLNGRSVWSAAAPPLAPSRETYRAIWINGRRARPARFPDKGYLKVESLPDKTAKWNEGQQRFGFKAGDLKAWPGAADAEAVVFNRWVESHLPIRSIDESTRTISFTKVARFQLEPGDPYYLQGAAEFLDKPGGWWLDRKAGVIYYMPLPDEDMAKALVVAPMGHHVLRLMGDLSTGKAVEHVIFRGLTFSHTDWGYPVVLRATTSTTSPAVGGFPQAAAIVPGAVYAQAMRNCAFEQCAFTQLNTYAIELAQACSANRISRCEMSDLGAGGVKIGQMQIRPDKKDQTFANEVSDCHIHDGGLVFDAAIGIWVGQSYDNRIVHNHIHDFHYTGISLGWTWGYDPKALATGNLVEFNHVHHIGMRQGETEPLLSDMGGIYTLGLHTGTIIRNNIFHDITGRKYGGWGIYFDEGTTNIVAQNNLVYRTTHGGFHQHYGKDNTVRNNIFAFGRDAQVQRSRIEEHRSFTFERNVVLWDKGPLFAGNWSKLNVAFANNLYWWGSGADFKFGPHALEQWKKLGMDQDSLIADPLLVDPAKGDFGLRDGSPAAKIGFVLPDWSKAGPRRQ
jgi:hypothetical protein